MDDELDDSSTFNPIIGLRFANLSTILVFLSNRATYLSEVKDSWFDGTKLTSRNVSSSILSQSSIPVYESPQPASVLGCIEVLKLCNPNHGSGPHCAVVPVSEKLGPVMRFLELNQRQWATADRLHDSFGRTGLQLSAYVLGGNGLLASSYIQDNLSPGLPNDQWELEVKNWFATSLTALQLFTAQYVTGYEQPSLNKYVTAPSKENKWMCTNQMVQRDRFSSFSVLGLATILVCCGLIMVLSGGLNRIVPRIPSKSATKQRNDLEWRAYDILQMHCDTSDNASEGSTRPYLLKIPNHELTRASLKDYITKWFLPRGIRLRKGRFSASQQPSDESPASATHLFPHGKAHSYTQDPDLVSPVSPQSVMTLEKVQTPASP